MWTLAALKNTMRPKISVVMMGVLLVIMGCNQPESVELIDTNAGSQIIEVRSIDPASDPLLLLPSVDTSGLAGTGIPLGMVNITGVRYDGQAPGDSFLHAEAAFVDTTSPLVDINRVVAYRSLDAGTLRVNDDTLARISREVLTSQSAVPRLVGYLYRFNGPYSYQPGVLYTWAGSGSGQMGSFEITIAPGPSIRVLELAPGTISPGFPLTVRWACDNPEVKIIISRDGESAQRPWVPLLVLRVKNRAGGCVIPAKILGILPVDRFGRFLLSFVSEVQFTTSISGYPGSVLVRAASIHNKLLNVRAPF